MSNNNGTIQTYAELMERCIEAYDSHVEAGRSESDAKAMTSEQFVDPLTLPAALTMATSAEFVQREFAKEDIVSDLEMFDGDMSIRDLASMLIRIAVYSDLEKRQMEIDDLQ